ncbi:MAG: hypothetical protein HRU19_16310 [Pseudobacteriovorax sp.]|nr:hypothetical protein [Pseudobacteriovorax sp.]
MQLRNALLGAGLLLGSLPAQAIDFGDLRLVDSTLSGDGCRDDSFFHYWSRENRSVHVSFQGFDLAVWDPQLSGFAGGVTGTPRSEDEARCIGELTFSVPADMRVKLDSALINFNHDLHEESFLGIKFWFSMNNGPEESFRYTFPENRLPARRSTRLTIPTKLNQRWTSCGERRVTLKFEVYSQMFANELGDISNMSMSVDANQVINPVSVGLNVKSKRDCFSSDRPIRF